MPARSRRAAARAALPLFLLPALSGCGGAGRTGSDPAATAGAASGPDSGFRSGVFEPPRLAPDFELQGSGGLPLTLAQFRGKVVVVEFGFTMCPSICPVTLANVTQALRILGPKSADVQLIFVTVDPQRDTPERLREFLAHFDPRFLGVTGTAERLQAVNQEYGVEATKAVSANVELGYEVHHSSSIYLVDRAGRLRVLVPFGRPPEDIAHDLEQLLSAT